LARQASECEPEGIPGVERRRVVPALTKRVSEIADGRPTCDGLVVHAPIRHRSGTIAQAVRALDDAGVGIDDIAIRRPTLDDVFIALTGHAAEEEATAESAEEVRA